MILKISWTLILAFFKPKVYYLMWKNIYAQSDDVYFCIVSSLIFYGSIRVTGTSSSAITKPLLAFNARFGFTQPFSPLTFKILAVHPHVGIVTTICTEHFAPRFSFDTMIVQLFICIKFVLNVFLLLKILIRIRVVHDWQFIKLRTKLTKNVFNTFWFLRTFDFVCLYLDRLLKYLLRNGRCFSFNLCSPMFRISRQYLSVNCLYFVIWWNGKGRLVVVWKSINWM